jgi:hypothetical protein
MRIHTQEQGVKAATLTPSTDNYLKDESLMNKSTHQAVTRKTLRVKISVLGFFTLELAIIPVRG